MYPVVEDPPKRHLNEGLELLVMVPSDDDSCYCFCWKELGGDNDVDEGSCPITDNRGKTTTHNMLGFVFLCDVL